MASGCASAPIERATPSASSPRAIAAWFSAAVTRIEGTPMKASSHEAEPEAEIARSAHAICSAIRGPPPSSVMGSAEDDFHASSDARCGFAGPTTTRTSSSAIPARATPSSTPSVWFPGSAPPSVTRMRSASRRTGRSATPHGRNSRRSRAKRVPSSSTVPGSTRYSRSVASRFWFSSTSASYAGWCAVSSSTSVRVPRARTARW